MLGLGNVKDVVLTGNCCARNKYLRQFCLIIPLVSLRKMNYVCVYWEIGFWKTSASFSCYNCENEFIVGIAVKTMRISNFDQSCIDISLWRIRTELVVQWLKAFIGSLGPYKANVENRQRRPKPVVTFKCKLCYQEFPGSFASRQHKNTQHGFPIKTANVHPVDIIHEVEDANLKQELRSCQFFLVDSELERARRTVSNYVIQKFNTKRLGSFPTQSASQR